MGDIIRISKGIASMPEWELAEPVDFTLSQGEHIAIVGPNGSGKTKLADIISGKHPLKTGRPFYDFSPSKKPLVCDNVKYMVFQDCYGGETDRNYYMQQRWNQMDVTDERILMSSGELRKYVLNKTLSSIPRVLILDNPFIGLDSASRDYLRDILRGIAEKGETQLIILLSRADEIPGFITHVVEVRDRVVLPKVRREDYVPAKVPTRMLSAEKEAAILNLPEFPVANPATDEIVRLNKVDIVYGERTILKGLDWVVNNGERWSLTGPNGSGKSTLLSLVCADNPQGYARDITLFGKRRGSGETIWEIKRPIGYVSPEMHRSCKRTSEVIRIVAGGLKDSIGLFVKPTEEDIVKSRFWMDIFGISHLENRPFMTLSSGEQRLVLLARAFVKNPQLLILDEPFHGLDNERRELAKEVIETYCKQKDKTMIMVTHYLEELPDCIDHNLTLVKH